MIEPRNVTAVPLDSSDPRRRRAPEERPTQILDAAFHEFGERGLAGARLEDIARRAGIAKGTIYLYFPNKEALFQEMIRHTIVAALEEAEANVARLEGIGAAEQLREFFVNWWSFLRSDRFQSVQRLVMAEIGSFPELLRFYAEEVVARGRRLIGGIVARGTARGEFRKIEPDVAARMLQALAMSHSIWCAKRHAFDVLKEHDDASVRDQILAFYLHALRPTHEIRG